MRDFPVIYRDRKGKEQEAELLRFYELLADGRLSVTTPVRYRDEAEFLPLQDHPELGKAVPQLEQEYRHRNNRILTLLILGLFWGLAGFLPWLHPGAWQLMSCYTIFWYPLFSCPFLLGSRKDFFDVPFRSWLLYEMPYLNIITGPVSAFRHYRGRKRFAALLGWTAFTLLLITMWCMPNKIPTARLAAALNTVCLGCVCLLHAFSSYNRLRLKAIRRRAGFRRVKGPVEQVLSKLRWNNPRERKRRLNGYFKYFLTCLVLPGGYLAVYFAVGFIRFHSASQAAMAAGLPPERPVPSANDVETAALLDAMHFAPVPENLNRLSLHTDLLLAIRNAPPAFAEELRQYVGDNEGALQELDTILAHLPADLWQESRDIRRIRNRKYERLRDLLTARYILLPATERLRSTPEYLEKLQTLSYISAYGRYGRIGSVPLLEQYIPHAPEVFLREELSRLTFLEKQLADEMRLFRWRILFIIQDAFTQESGHYISAQEKANLIYSALAETASYPEYVHWKPRTAYPLNPYLHTYLLLADRAEEAFAYSNALAQLRTARTGVAAELYSRKHNVYPDNLQQLTPEFLAAVPNDPYTGKPLRYNKGIVEVPYTDITVNGNTFEGTWKTGQQQGIEIHSSGRERDIYFSILP